MIGAQIGLGKLDGTALQYYGQTPSIEFQGMPVSYIIACVAAALVSGLVSASAWSRRDLPAARTIAGLMAALAIWALFSGAIEVAQALSVKLFLTKVYYLVIVTIPIFVWVLALQYTGHDRWITRRTIALIALVPMLTVLIIWTNPMHHLFWTKVVWNHDDIVPRSEFFHGTFYWVWTAYAYTVFVASIVLFLRSLRRMPGLFRTQNIVIMLAILAPLLGNLSYLFEVTPWPYLDMTPLCFVISGLAITWGIFKLHISNVVPVARDAVFHSMTDAVFVLDSADRLVDLNESGARIVHRDASEIVGENADHVFESLPDVQKFIERGGAARAEVRANLHGQYRYFQLSMAPIIYRKDVKVGQTLTLTDVTEKRREAEEIRQDLERKVASQTQELRESEHRYRDLVDRSPDAVWRMNSEGVRTFFSHAIKGISGFEPEELVGLDAATFHLKFYADNTPMALARYRREEIDTQQRVTEIPCRRKDGKEFIAEIRSAPLFNSEGEIAEIHGILRDVTERNRAREKLKKNLSDAYRAEQLAKVGTYEWDWVSDRLISCSEEYARMHEMTVSKAIEIFDIDQYYRYVHPEDRPAYIEVNNASVERKEGYSSSFRLLLPSGNIRHIREVCELEVDEHGKVIRLLGALQDITEQIQLEEQLRQSQKMEAIGQLAGGIAHDFNNLLTAINGYSDLLLKDLAQNDPAHHNVSEIRKAGERAAALTGQLLAYSRQQILRQKVINPSEIVMGMADMLRRLIGEHIELRIAADSEFCVKADPGQIEQVVMNLLINARDAMPGGGVIQLALKNTALESDGVVGELCAGDYVLISVSDRGVGMSELTVSRIFDPFFTTKGDKRGTGLGLSTVLGIVKQSGGDVVVTSELGKGTSFAVYLPRDNSKKHLAPPAPRAINSKSEGEETILLVDDEPVIRELLEFTLDSHGYTVLAAEHGEEALHMASHHEGPIHLMITDVVMPRMSGHELARQMAKLRPDMYTLYMSGYNEEMVNDQGLVNVEERFLQKPLELMDIGRKVREILDKQDGWEDLGS